MDELTFLEVDDSGTHLVVQDAAGTRYRLEITSALAAALHQRPSTGAAASSRSAASAPTAMTPRDVQAMIRAGASTQQVADMSGWSTDKVSRYEAPILAEREHVAALARAVHLPSFGRGPSPTLEKRAKERLVMRGLRPDEASWDAWRLDGNPWAVSLSFEAGGRERRAVWHFDLISSALTPQDDEARWLSTAEEDGYDSAAQGVDSLQQDEGPAEPSGHQPVSHAARAGVSHERPLRAGDSLQGEPAGSGQSEQPADQSGPSEQSETPRHRDQHEQALAEGSAPQDQAGTGSGESQAPEQQDATDQQASADQLPLEETESAPIAPRQRQSRRGKGRPSVPSWDDIMFGGSKS
ncbi:septation protein SepH [Kytococcus sedentarius]|uniref:septation protein SepH n=1 Tax=Kytococcus sedentarius TaxID=1276 RepID=UPI0035BC3BED